MNEASIKVGDIVQGGYTNEDGVHFTFIGTVLAAFQKSTGHWWCAVEDANTMLYLYKASDLKLILCH